MCPGAKETVNFKLLDGMQDVITYPYLIDIYPQICTIILFFVILGAHISES